MRSRPPSRRRRDPTISRIYGEKERQRDQQIQEERDRQRLASEQLAAQRRRADEAERRRKQQGNQSQADTSNRRLASLERQWSNFRANVIQAERRALEDQKYQNALRMLDQMIAANNPPEPPASEPEVVYVEDEDRTKLHWPTTHRWW